MGFVFCAAPLLEGLEFKDVSCREDFGDVDLLRIIGEELPCTRIDVSGKVFTVSGNFRKWSGRWLQGVGRDCTAYCSYGRGLDRREYGLVLIGLVDSGVDSGFVFVFPITRVCAEFWSGNNTR